MKTNSCRSFDCGGAKEGGLRAVAARFDAGLVLNRATYGRRPRTASHPMC